MPAAPDNSASRHDPRPIYILGTNALACYLAAKFTDAGERVIIITGRRDKHSLNTNGISLKEDFSLRKNRYLFETSFWTGEDGKMLIITSSESDINAAVTAVSPEKICNIPVICFTLLKETAYLRDILGSGFSKALFKGWVNKNDQQVIFFGRAPTITVYSPVTENLRQPLEEIFSQAGLKLQYADSETETFWNHFAVYAAASLLTAAYDQNIAQIIKNKNTATRLPLAVNEICSLAAAEKVPVNPEDILKQIYNIPSGYVFPLHAGIKSSRASGFDMISTVLLSTSRKHNLPIPELKRLMKNIYEIYLSIT